MSKKTLHECAIITMGQSPNSKSYNGHGDGLPFYQGNADFGEINPIRRYYCNKPSKIANRNDILLSVRAPIGAVNIAVETCCIGRGLCAISEKRDITYYKYLYYFLLSRHTELNSKGTGSTFKAISKSILLELSISLPPIEEQKRISRILDKVHDLISLKKKQISKLDLLVKSRFVEMFGDPISNSMGWEKILCKNIMSKIGSGATPKGGNENYKKEGISLIRSMNVHNDRFEYKDLAYIDDEQAGKLNYVKIEENDVLLNITGASVARCCVVPKEIIPARVNQHVSILRCRKDILPSFLSKQFTNKSFQMLLLNIATSGGATREAISKQQIEDIAVIVPPIELQNQFADFVQQIDKLKFELQKNINELTTLYNALMQKYFG